MIGDYMHIEGRVPLSREHRWDLALTHSLSCGMSSILQLIECLIRCTWLKRCSHVCADVTLLATTRLSYTALLASCNKTQCRGDL